MRGAPLKLTKAKKAEFVEHMAKGCTVKTAAHRTKVSASSIYAHRAEDPDFAAAIDEARELSDQEIVDALRNDAIAGNTTAQIFWLKNRQAGQWSDRHDLRVTDDRTVYKSEFFGEGQDYLYLPRLRSYQTRLVKDQAQEVACVSATQVGKTFGYGVKLLDFSWRYQGPHSPTWYAPSYRQSVPGQRVMYHLAHSAGIMQSGPKPPFRTNPPPPLMLINGTSIEFRTWDNPSNLMGDPIPVGVVEEAGLLTPLAHSAISTRRSETLGPLWFIGNPGMVSGPFRKICSRAEAASKDPDHPDRGKCSFHIWTWEDKHREFLLESPERAEEYKRFIDRERQSLPEYEFRRLYLAEWTEDESAVFRNIHECNGAPRVREPDGKPRVFGLDIGQSVDYLVAIGYRLDCNRADYIERFRGVGYPEAAQRLKRTQERFGGHYVLEINGPGIAVRQEFDRIGVQYVPFTTTNQSKQEIILNLATDFQEKRIEIADLDPLAYELEIYRYQRMNSGGYRYGAPEGEHDDTVMALALARHGKLRTYQGPVLEWVS